MDRADLERWFAMLGQAWEMADAGMAASLFDEQVVYQESPFDPPIVGHEAVNKYWLENLATQREVKFRGTVIAFSGGVGVVNWRVEFIRVGTGEAVQLDGVSVGSFSPEGKPIKWREWWHRRE